ncbi:hypothetical protein AAY473_036033, partial [Plecturocebus cupreus]
MAQVCMATGAQGRLRDCSGLQPRRNQLGPWEHHSVLEDKFEKCTCPKAPRGAQRPGMQPGTPLRSPDLGNKPQLCQACSPYPTQPPSGLPPHLGLPVASTSTSANQGSPAPVLQQELGRAKMAKASQATKMPRLSPLQAVGGEFGPTKAHTPFSLSALKQINVDLGNFPDDPDKYIDVLQGLGQSFELDWKETMLLLNQTLTSNEREAAPAVAQEFGDTWYLSQVRDLMTPEEKDRFPTERQVAPSMDPHSIEDQVILKDKFIMQSAADIRRKLQKLALGPEQSLESLLYLATSVFYNRDQEERAKRNRRDQKKATALVMALRQAGPRGSNEEKTRVWTTNHLVHARCAKGITGKHDVPGDKGSQGL